ncbi:MAG TPA: hypothetical protein VGB95_03565 [Chitinophagales bacterium]
MKKMFLSFAVVAGVVLAACNNKPAEEAVETAVDSAVVEAAPAVDSAAVAVDSAAAKTEAAAEAVKEEVKK